jgi:hypothetical protein
VRDGQRQNQADRRQWKKKKNKIFGGGGCGGASWKASTLNHFNDQTDLFSTPPFLWMPIFRVTLSLFLSLSLSFSPSLPLLQLSRNGFFPSRWKNRSTKGQRRSKTTPTQLCGHLPSLYKIRRLHSKKGEKKRERKRERERGGGRRRERGCSSPLTVDLAATQNSFKDTFNNGKEIGTSFLNVCGAI